MFLLGVRLDNLNLKESLEKMASFLTDGRQHYIVLPYADFLVRAQEDADFRRILNEADLSLTDGVGPVLASYILGKEKLKTRVMGVDLIWALFEEFGTKNSFFFFGGQAEFGQSPAERGAKEGVAQEAAKNIWQKAPQAKIVGTLNGYVSDEEAISEINDKKPEILLAALGMPKQEKWIYDNLKKMPSVKLAIGVGGAFDFIAGRVRRAPRWVQNIGMEWLWRLFMRPNQWRKTWRSVIVFSWLIAKDKLKIKTKMTMRGSKLEEELDSLIEKIGADTNSSQKELNKTKATITKRLILELRDFNKSSEKYNRNILLLTSVLLIIGYSQLLVSIWMPESKEAIKWLVALIGIVVFYFMTLLKK